VNVLPGLELKQDTGSLHRRIEQRRDENQQWLAAAGREPVGDGVVRGERRIRELR